ncbi:MAG TPA: hypothetical protein VGY53_00625, partial [Isosphaeraceae bacterium]|nr:hypothetical protein [Isosphaeraceae bacterium]
MRLPHVRFSVRSMMLGIFIVCLTLGIFAHCQQMRRIKQDLRNQFITIQGAYAAYQNAALAHENARSSATMYLEKIGKGSAKRVYAELSTDEDPEDQVLKAMKIANKKALENEWAKKA